MRLFPTLIMGSHIRYKNKPSLVRSRSSPSVNGLAPSSKSSGTSTFTFPYAAAQPFNPSKTSSNSNAALQNTRSRSLKTPAPSSNTYTPSSTTSFAYKAPLATSTSAPTPRSVGFSFRPFYVKKIFFCEHDDTDEDKVSEGHHLCHNPALKGVFFKWGFIVGWLICRMPP